MARVVDILAAVMQVSQAKLESAATVVVFLLLLYLDSHDDVDPRIGLDNVAHFVNLKCKPIGDDDGVTFPGNPQPFWIKC